MDEREYDLIIVGAAGFTGRLVVEQIQRFDRPLRDANGRRRWAVSGRSASGVANVLGTETADLPDIIVADLADPASLPALTRRTGTILNLAGPFTPTAPNLIAACVATGTSYVDLSGEIPLLRDINHRFHGAAIDARIRIVQMAGWEALPADLTTLLASRRAATNDAAGDVEGPGAASPVATALVSTHFHRMPGSNLPVSQQVSAGTLSSIVEMLESDDAALIGRPDALLPAGLPANVLPAGLRLRPFNAKGRLLAPFVPVAFLNAPVIHRTAALRAQESGLPYRPSAYLEGNDEGKASGVFPTRRSAIAWAKTGLQRTIIGIARAPAPIRRVLAKRLRRMVPPAGTGPTGQFLTDWGWSVHAEVRTIDGQIGTACLDGIGHPGYTATAAMIAEVSLRIALGRVPERFGCITPALALGSLDLDEWFVEGFRLR